MPCNRGPGLPRRGAAIAEVVDGLLDDHFPKLELMPHETLLRCGLFFQKVRQARKFEEARSVDRAPSAFPLQHQNPRDPPRSPSEKS